MARDGADREVCRAGDPAALEGAGGERVQRAGGRVYLTDRVVEPEQQERVHCLDWETGKPLWTHAYPVSYGGVGYPDGPRASVTVHDGRAYALGAVGNLACLGAKRGALLWSR